MYLSKSMRATSIGIELRRILAAKDKTADMTRLEIKEYECLKSH